MKNWRGILRLSLVFQFFFNLVTEVWIKCLTKKKHFGKELLCLRTLRKGFLADLLPKRSVATPPMGSLLADRSCYGDRGRARLRVPGAGQGRKGVFPGGGGPGRRPAPEALEPRPAHLREVPSASRREAAHGLRAEGEHPGHRVSQAQAALGEGAAVGPGRRGDLPSSGATCRAATAGCAWSSGRSGS